MMRTLASPLAWLRPRERVPLFVPPPAEIAAPASDDRPKKQPLWSPERIAAMEALWGVGFMQPGGPAEVQRLVNPLGLSSASTLLLIGGGTGGPLRTLVEMGPWVSCFEADPELLAIAASRKLPGKLGKRASIQPFDPDAPNLRAGYYHHALALQPFRHGSVESLLAACEAALKPYGHLVLLDVVADRTLNPKDTTLRAWMQADGRVAEPPAANSVTRALTRLGFDVHVMEDLSQNHERQAIAGWRGQIRALQNARPGNAFAAALVQEAERWLLRLRLMGDGKLKLMRWHAMKNGKRMDVAPLI